MGQIKNIKLHIVTDIKNYKKRSIILLVLQTLIEKLIVGCTKVLAIPKRKLQITYRHHLSSWPLFGCVGFNYPYFLSYSLS